MANHAATAVPCDQNQRARLEHLEASGATPQKIVLRARLILRAADGVANMTNALNTDPKLFTWTRDADTILAKIAKCKEAFGTLH